LHLTAFDGQDWRCSSLATLLFLLLCLLSLAACEQYRRYCRCQNLSSHNVDNQKIVIWCVILLVILV
jgi:hypothetical protein